MSAFQHVISLLSFVYALAIAHLLTTVARLIAARERVRFSWLHAYWMLNALFVLVADWISYWDMRTVPNWTMVSILVVLLQSFVDYMQAALVCPEIPMEGNIDLVAYHRTRSGRYAGAFVAAAVMALVDNLYFAHNYDIRGLIQQNLAVVPMIVAGLTAAIFRNRWVQIVAALSLALIFIYYFTSLQSALH